MIVVSNRVLKVRSRGHPWEPQIVHSQQSNQAVLAHAPWETWTNHYCRIQVLKVLCSNCVTENNSCHQKCWSPVVELPFHYILLNLACILRLDTNSNWIDGDSVAEAIQIYVGSKNCLCWIRLAVWGGASSVLFAVALAQVRMQYMWITMWNNMLGCLCAFCKVASMKHDEPSIDEQFVAYC